MNYICIDLGSTNIKVGLFSQEMKNICFSSSEVSYIRSNGFVEFDAREYALKVLKQIKQLNASDVSQIILTGQAESLVVLDSNKNPLCNAISWMDERSSDQCKQVLDHFTLGECYAVTGQQAVLPTWPATKIMWLRENRREIFEKAGTYMLLKDYIVFFLTSELVCDKSIATFTFYFDIHNGIYWKKMIDFIGIKENQLPPLVEPCSIVGNLNVEASQLSGLPSSVRVNVGTLDHFSGMIGVGNVRKGIVSYSTGTVMALATIADDIKENCRVALHYGFTPGSLIMLPVAESGGSCLQWYRDNFMKDVPFKKIDETLETRKLPNDVIFLPYIVGTNAPEFDKEASGVFFGMRSDNDSYDLAYAVMEGVGHLLRKNCDAIADGGTEISCIIATGGGAKSPIWCQIQSSLTGCDVKVPSQKEASILGCAIIGAVTDKVFESFDQAVKLVEFSKIYHPKADTKLLKKHEMFNRLYESCLELARS